MVVRAVNGLELLRVSDVGDIRCRRDGGGPLSSGFELPRYCARSVPFPKIGAMALELLLKRS